MPITDSGFQDSNLKHVLNPPLYELRQKVFCTISYQDVLNANTNLILFFMDDFENEHFSDMKRLGVKIWFRYVDDTFEILNSKDHVIALKNFLCNAFEIEFKVVFVAPIELRNLY